MAKRMRRGWAGTLGSAALLAWANAAQAAPDVAQILGFTPRQPGVDCAMPTAEQQKGCKVSLLKGKKGSGWLLADAAGQPLRRFFDSDDNNHIDVWSYCKDGVEVYREIDANKNNKPDQYRWVNAGGTKWGVDVNEDGRIDSWKAISAEEASKEMLQALATGDWGRMQALLLTEAEIKALDVSDAEAAKMRESLKQAKTRFDDLAAKLKGLEKATWLHLETALPQCRLAETVSSRYDLVTQPRGTVIYEAAGKNDWLNTGLLVKVGDAWRLAEGPAQNAAAIEQPSPMGGGVGATSPKMQKKIEELTELDKANPPAAGGGPNEAVVKHHLKRANLLEAIVAEVPAKEREPWIRQVVDSLATALQSSGPEDKVAGERLARLERQVVAAMPGSQLAASIVYRRLQADYSRRLLDPKADYAKVQQDWIDKLAKFHDDYPKADEAPEALLELGKTCEFLLKEPEAKKWYAQLAKAHGDKAAGSKARGALKRLDLDGKEMVLAGATLDGGAWDMSRASGKTLAVYYWASWNRETASDFEKLKKLMESHSSKGFTVVCVNLDSTAADALAFLKDHPAPAPTLHAPGGLDGPLGVEHGIMVLPNLFLVGKDGKVASRSVQVTGLEDELKKLLK